MKKKNLSVTLYIAITFLTGCNLSEEAIEYAPTEEILNAKFNSGFVQFNNDVFQQG